VLLFWWPCASWHAVCCVVTVFGCGSCFVFFCGVLLLLVWDSDFGVWVRMSGWFSCVHADVTLVMCLGSRVGLLVGVVGGGGDIAWWLLGGCCPPRRELGVWPVVWFFDPCMVFGLC